MGKLLRVNTKEKTFNFEEVPQDYAGLGGRALTSKMILDEVPATCHPLGKANKLIFAPGILAGSPAADSGRLSAGAKSPLTGGIKESNAGGIVSQKLARLGITALILEGKPENDDYSMIVINNEGVEILPAGDLATLRAKVVRSDRDNAEAWGAEAYLRIADAMSGGGRLE